MNNSISRRAFAQSVGAAVTMSAAGAQAPLTAAEVVERIKKKLADEGVPWGPSAFDKFHLGDPAIPVIGIATTFQPTLEVL